MLLFWSVLNWVSLKTAKLWSSCISLPCALALNSLTSKCILCHFILSQPKSNQGGLSPISRWPSQRGGGLSIKHRHKTKWTGNLWSNIRCFLGLQSHLKTKDPGGFFFDPSDLINFPWGSLASQSCHLKQYIFLYSLFIFCLVKATLKTREAQS